MGTTIIVIVDGLVTTRAEFLPALTTKPVVRIDQFAARRACLRLDVRRGRRIHLLAARAKAETALRAAHVIASDRGATTGAAQIELRATRGTGNVQRIEGGVTDGAQLLPTIVTPCGVCAELASTARTISVSRC